MGVANTEIADFLFRMAELLELSGENRFKARAYRRAAITVAHHRQPLDEMVRRGDDLQALAGVGPVLASEIAEICGTGRLKALEALEAATPRPVAALSVMPGIGPKRLRILREELGIDSIAALERAAAEGRIHDLPHFGYGFEAKLLAAARSSPSRASKSVA